MLISTQPFIHFVLEAKARLKRLKAAKIPALIAEKIVLQPSFLSFFLKFLLNPVLEQDDPSL
ncbi:hypothetical protein DXT90_09270 [Agrobacterium tumefaciens]|nr:hypothetical protein [Agrobacterium tumefaciens]